MTAGLLGAMGQGMGLVLAKLGMNVTGNTQLAVSGGDVTGRIPLDPLSATLVRVAAGGIGVLAIAVVCGSSATLCMPLDAANHGDRSTGNSEFPSAARRAC